MSFKVEKTDTTYEVTFSAEAGSELIQYYRESSGRTIRIECPDDTSYQKICNYITKAGILYYHKPTTPDLHIRLSGNHAVSTTLLMLKTKKYISEQFYKIVCSDFPQPVDAGSLQSFLSEIQ